MTALVIALGVVVALFAVLVVGLLRSHAEILQKLHDLGVGDDPGVDDDSGSDAPVIRTRPGVPEPRDATGAAVDIVGVRPDGGRAAVSVSNSPATLLAFLSSTCLTCAGFWTAFGDPTQRRLPDRQRLVIVTKGPENESPSTVADLAPTGVTTVMSSQAWDDYNVPVAPYFLLIDGTTGEIAGEGAAATWEQVQGLLTNAAADQGFAANGDRTRSSKRRAAERDADSEEALMRAGIEPDDPSLYPDELIETSEPPA